MASINPKDIETWSTTSSSTTGGGGSGANNGSNPGGTGSSGNSGGGINLDPIIGIGPVNVDEETEKE